MSDEEKTKAAQKVFDAVLNAFPNLRSLMINTQKFVREHGYTETILGRRRHLPDMQLPEFEFKPLKGYVNPDVDPFNKATLQNTSEIPQRVVDQLTEEFKGYKYFGQIAKRTKELAQEEHIRVINNRAKINDASRQTVNSVIQGSAADQTKLAILLLESSEDWKKIGGRLLVPVHDELICEVPIQYMEEGGRLLSKLMCDAANYLPFDSKCDVTTTYRWYGEEIPCEHKYPSTLWTEDPEEIKWIQYHLVECEYQLPAFNDEDGNKPRGEAAHGINGIKTKEYESAIFDYMQKWKAKEDNFIEHIDRLVTQGIVA